MRKLVPRLFQSALVPVHAALALWALEYLEYALILPFLFRAGHARRYFARERGAAALQRMSP